MSCFSFPSSEIAPAPVPMPQVTSTLHPASSAPSSIRTHLSTCLTARPQTSNFLSLLPDHLLLSSLALPGTHESLATHGWPVSRCQAKGVTRQLEAGVRFMDVRIGVKQFAYSSHGSRATVRARAALCADATATATAAAVDVEDGSGKRTRGAMRVRKLHGGRAEWRMWAYHGVTDQRMDFGQVLVDIAQWLEGPGAQETIILSLKPEGGLSLSADEWVDFLYEAYIDPNDAWWYLQDRIPTLGEVRGRMVLFSRFTPQRGKEKRRDRWGINARRWPDGLDDVFSFPLSAPHQSVQIQDAYKMSGLMSRSSAHAKQNLIAQLLDAGGEDAEALSLNFCSGSAFPLALPGVVAGGIAGPPCLRVRGINQRVCEQLRKRLGGAEVGTKEKRELMRVEEEEKMGLGKATRRALACVFIIDFLHTDPISKQLVELVIAANF